MLGAAAIGRGIENVAVCQLILLIQLMPLWPEAQSDKAGLVGLSYLSCNCCADLEPLLYMEYFMRR
jgi:hypothetical protein